MFRIFSKKRSINNAIIGRGVKMGTGVSVGPGTIIGYGNEEDGEIVIGDNVSIGAYCLISFGAVIADDVKIDDYCKVGVEVQIGKSTRLLYGKHIYDEAIIGSDCIIGGHVADRTVIQDKVTFMGEIAHSHHDPNSDWDATIEPSPIIKSGSVVGVNAILIGGITIGPCAYIGAGEIFRSSVGEGMCFVKGKQELLKKYRGIFKSRCNEKKEL